MDVSIVIPVFNESANLALLEKRLMPAARALGRIGPKAAVAVPALTVNRVCGRA